MWGVGMDRTHRGMAWRGHSSGVGWRGHRKGWNGGNIPGVLPVPTGPSPSAGRLVSDTALSLEALSSVGQGPVRTEPGPPLGAKALPRPCNHPARPRGPPLPSPTPPVPTRSGTAVVPARPALPSCVQFPACPGWAGWGHQQGRRRRHRGLGPWRGQGCRKCGPPWMAATGMRTWQLGYILPPFGCRC